MQNLVKLAYGQRLMAGKAFFSGIRKVAYQVVPFMEPTYDENDEPQAVAFKIHNKVYYGEPESGELMHVLLMTNLPEEEQTILFGLTEENDEICAGFYSKNGCFYNREQNKEFFGFERSEQGFKKTKKLIEQKPELEVTQFEDMPEALHNRRT